MPPKKQTAGASKKGAASQDNGSSVADTETRPRRAAASAAAKKIKMDEYDGGDSDHSFERAAKSKPTRKRGATGKGDAAKKAPQSKKSKLVAKNGSSKVKGDSSSGSDEHSEDEEMVIETKKGKAVAKKPAQGTATGKKGKAPAKASTVYESDESEEEEEKTSAVTPKNGKAAKVSKSKPKVEDDESEDVKTKKGGKPAATKKSAAKSKKVKEESEESEEEEEEAKPVPVKKGRVAAAKKPKVADSDSDDAKGESSDEEEVKSKKAKVAVTKKPAAAKKTKSAAKSKGKAAGSDEVKDEKADTKKVRTLIVKGKAPVDPLCTIADSAHVYCEGDDVFDATLNQTNLQFNNNKYYLLQLLEDDHSANYSVWFRWGRVGKDGQNKLEKHGSNLQAAKQSFEKKFADKTKNQWEERHEFEKVSGQYDLLQMDYSADSEVTKKDEADAKAEKKPVNIPESKLDKSVQQLINLICNVKAMEDAVMEMQFDTDKSPLGKLTTDQIKAGYLALKTIEELVNQNVTSGAKLVQACNDFYTRIPHSFGMKTPPLINSMEAIKRKIDLLEALGDIQVAIKMLNTALGEPENPVDNQYKGLDCQLTSLAPDSEAFGIVESYLKNSHEKTHNMYQMKIVNVFQCEKESERDAFVNYGNRMLLWHGSRLTNWAGILKQGLRIAPPEAPVTGYMFGKGVYFADRCSKSANYCCTSPSKNMGLLLLCEVSLGDCNELLQANYSADRLPQGKNSVKGLGQYVPTASENITLPDGTIVPLGKSLASKDRSNYSLLYNEYIVYRREQIKMRYLVEVKFVYGRS